MILRITAYYSAEPCAPQCELDDARVSLYNCHRTFFSDKTRNVRVLLYFTAPLTAHRTRRRPLEFRNINSAAHFAVRA